ncbi:MAG TPA: alcohol dehydrogenase catalytic domain-containing protein, partial [Trueperaceae bacterium]|nr:alcohol dehydrogenase catalytic domain-containing protein [Trueperaceae bacterium]
MKAARYLGPGQLAIEEIDVPAVGDGDVLVKMRACGVCGTDVKTYLRGHPMIQPGSVLGHEVAGEVVESRHPRFGVGQRVALGPYAPCGECSACSRGHPSLCSNLGRAFAEPGGFAEYLRVPRALADQVMHVLPDTMSYELAALTEPLACCVHGLEALQLQQGGSLLIIGDGPMGLMQAAIAGTFGAGRVIVAGATPHRLAYAARLADTVIDVTQTVLEERVAELLPDGPDAVMVSVASLPALDQAMNLVAKGGTINVFAGMPKGETFPLDLKRVHYDEVRVVGTFGYGPADFSR